MSSLLNHGRFKRFKYKYLFCLKMYAILEKVPKEIYSGFLRKYSVQAHFRLLLVKFFHPVWLLKTVQLLERSQLSFCALKNFGSARAQPEKMRSRSKSFKRRSILRSF